MFFFFFFFFFLFRFFLWRITIAWSTLVEGHHENISAKLYWNRPRSFRQEDFNSFLYRYKGEISSAPPGESWRLETSWYRVTKETFLPSYIEIGPMVYDEKIFKVFYIDIYREKKVPPPWGHVLTYFLYRYKGKISPAPWRIYFNKSQWLKQSWKMVTEDTFLPSYIEIDPVDSYKKIFNFFCIDI